ncbi:MAG: S8/S53 family peptidase [Anaerolineae bacterium]|nr:S8/S53 family peptidase [Anaerolineae bacterium]
MRNRTRIFRVICVFLISVLSLVACNGDENIPLLELQSSPADPSTFPQPVQTEKLCSPLSAAASSNGLATYAVMDDQSIIANHLIFFGYAADMDQLVLEFGDALGIAEDTEPLDQISFEAINDYFELGENSLPIDYARSEFRLYQVDPDYFSTLLGGNTDIFAYIRENDLQVFIDFNYLTSSPVSSSSFVTADPASGEPGGTNPDPASGEPGGTNPDPASGEPGGTNPDPHENPGSPTSIAMTGNMRAQWAFTAINWPAPAPGENDIFSGQEVKVAVFDTSPYPAQKSAYGIHWASPQLDLCVSQPYSVVAIDPFEPLPDISDHGLFVAGLIHAAAPGSDIEIVRVLGDDGRGDSFTLIKALSLYALREAAGSPAATPLKNHVINLSLGIENKGVSIPQIDDEMEDYFRQLREEAYGIPYDEPLHAVNLRFPFQILRELGATIVAASGNDSQSPNHQPLQLPAALKDVIGVAGSTVDGDMSCFSNMGQVLAPGGDAGQNCAERIHDLCYSNTPCTYGLVSLTHRFPMGYAVWYGTSFSTPLVSGLAALILDACPTASPYAILTNQLNANLASAGGLAPPPMINIADALATCLPHP